MTQVRIFSRFCIGFMLCGALLILDGWSGEAAPPEPGRLALTTERVVIFKDGFGLFVKSAAGTADAQGRVFTQEVPDGAVLGCFWATTADGSALGMRAEWDEKTEVRESRTPCITVLELLRANRGRKVKLGLTREHAPDLEGALLEVLDLPPEKVPAPAPAGEIPPFPSARWGRGEAAVPSPDRPEERVRELIPRGGQLAVLENDQGRTVVPVAEVRTVNATELKTEMDRKEEVTSRRKRLSFDLGQAAAGKPAVLRLIYFSEGVRWIPTYRVAGPLDNQAELSLQGEILNEAEDFAEAQVDLVVGVPHFRFKETISPFSLEATLRQALAAAAPGLMAQQQLRNASFDNRAGEWRGGGARTDREAADVLALAPELAAAGQQDLFVYSAPKLSLKRGARASLPLWQSRSPVRHLFTFDVTVARDARTGGEAVESASGGRERSPLRLSERQVWHQLELRNQGQAPWTTGAALLLRENLPLGQDLLTYTPPGGVALLPVTVAVDLSGGYREEELERKPNAMQWDQGLFALIRKRATVTLTNSRTEKREMRVTVSTGGRAEKASDGGTVRMDDFHIGDWPNGGNRPVNNHSDVTWDLTLEPGQTKTLTVEIAFYVY